MKPHVLLPGLAFALFLGNLSVRAQQAQFDLREFLPYKRNSSSSLLSVTGGDEFRFFSTRDNEFFWDFRKGTPQRRVNFRSMSLRLDAAGLSISGDTYYDPLAHGNLFRPAWVIAPAGVVEGQIIESSATITPVGVGSQWTGTVKGSVTIGAVTTHPTIAGRLSALPLTFRYEWAETGEGNRGSGTVAQTWWMTREIGVVNVEFAYAETNASGVVSAGNDQFALWSTTLPFSPGVVTFPDPNLEAAVRARLSKPVGDLTALDLGGLADLPAESRGITNLSGLEFANRLSILRLMSNQVADVSPLENMIGLKILDLAHNQVRNLQPLKRLTSLTSLALTRNGITDLSPLAALTRLQVLNADENQINDVSALGGLTNLSSLVLGANQIRDVHPLAGLTLLTQLEIEANRIADITPLTPLIRLQNVSVEENCLDVRPGADDRLVIDGWIRSRIQVEEEWPMQNDCASTEVRLDISRDGGVLVLGWRSAVGVFYRIESSFDLANWANAHPDPISGTGAIILWPVPQPAPPQSFFRLRIVSGP